MTSDSRFKKRSRSERLENVRSERATAVPEEPKLVFNFKDFDASQSVSQSFEAWQKAGKLADLMVKLQHLSQWSLTEAIAGKQVAVYGAFPAGSDFRPPKHIAPDVQWAVIKGVKGQKGRVAGYVIGNVFYVVFLDQNHRFWVTEKNGT